MYRLEKPPMEYYFMTETTVTPVLTLSARGLFLYVEIWRL